MEDGEEGSLAGVAMAMDDKFEDNEVQGDILDMDFDFDNTVCCSEEAEERLADMVDNDDDDDNEDEDNTDEFCHDTPEVENFFALLPE